MARKVSIVLVDDLNGGPADETVQFKVGSTGYEIDLSAANAAAFRGHLAPFIKYARHAGRAPRPRGGQGASARAHNGSIRAWAKEHGIAIKDRGRIPAHVVERYEAASS